MGSNITYPADSKVNNFSGLRRAFWWLFLASLLSLFVILIPIAAIIGFIGFIFLILGYRSASKYPSETAKKYAKTEIVLAIAFAIWVVSVFVALRSPFVALIPFIFASILGYATVIKSLRFMATDLGRPEFRRAAGYLIAAIALWALSLVTAIVVALFIFGSLTNAGFALILVITGLFNPAGFLASFAIMIIVPFVLIYIGMIFTTLGYAKASKTLKTLIQSPSGDAPKLNNPGNASTDMKLAPASQSNSLPAVSDNDSEKLYCNECGSGNLLASKFCFKCGSKMNQ